MDRRQALDAVRAMLADMGADAVIVPSNDCHFGEYVPDCFKVREWLSGFDGSAGTLVVTTEKAALWTDSRYFIQAARQLEGSSIELMKLKVAGTPSIAQWLHSLNVSKVIVDGDLFSRQEFLSLTAQLAPAVLEAVEDPFREIWKDRPAMVSKPIVNMPESISGASIEDKRSAVAGKLACNCAPLVFNARSTDTLRHIDDGLADHGWTVLPDFAERIFYSLKDSRSQLSSQRQEFLTTEKVSVNYDFRYIQRMQPLCYRRRSGNFQLHQLDA